MLAAINRMGVAETATVQVALAGVASTFPAASSAATVKVWLPSDSPEALWPELHGWAAAPSKVHRKPAPASLEVKAKVAPLESTVPLGAEVSVVSGATVSTVQLRPEGALALPAASRARTEKVCAPSARPA